LILFAIPTSLGGSPADVLPAATQSKIRLLKDFAVENAKTARAFLGSLGLPVRDLNIFEFEKHDHPLAPLHEGRNLGLLSEAGCPAIADPGASLVEAAHREGFKVVPLVGPSSLILALMASGLEGQRFAFCGYLPREAPEREKKIRALEKRSRSEDETELFIETPYRNDVLLTSLLSTLSSNTTLCLASDLTLASETVKTKTVAEWREAPTRIGKRPTVFLLLAR
jgi:16S rRNA (cytidine1402-2'-O)-methyltransferase